MHADKLTRCSDQYAELVLEKGWHEVDIRDALQQAVIDSERFGPSLLAWEEPDRQALMQLKERRLRRAIPSYLRPKWESFEAVELGGTERLVFDFVEATQAADGKARATGWRGPIT